MSAPDVTPPVERLHRVLIDEIAKRQPDYLDRPFTVAEIYQSLVPYRSHRDAIGVQMNGDYEDALLRLLAGAGDFVVLESPSALGEIRKELESRNPNTGLFREFPDAAVRLNQDALPPQVPLAPTAFESSVSRPAPPPEAEPSNGIDMVEAAAAEAEETVARYEPVPVVEPPPLDPEPIPIDRSTTFAGPPASASPPEPVSPAATAPESTPPAPAPLDPAPSFSILPASEPDPLPEPELRTRIASSFVEAEITPVARPEPTIPAPATTPSTPSQNTERGACSWCVGTLPARDNVNFCPHCGKSTDTKPCGGCGEEMEMGWRYCATCGRESTTGLA